MKELFKGGPTPDEILSGGSTLELEMVDRAGGKFLRIPVIARLIPVKDYPALRRSLADESELARLYLRADGLPPSAELTPASHELLLDVGRRVNAHFFDCWLPRQRELENMANSALSEDLIAAAAREFVSSYKAQTGEPQKSETSGRGAPIAPPVGAKVWKPSAA